MNYESTYLAHHGILGMKWGVRRYQNEDGTRTEAGKRRYRESADANTDTYKTKKSSSTTKTLLKVGAVAAGVALASYAAYKMGPEGRDKLLFKAGGAAYKAKEGLKRSVAEAGKAMTTAAIMSIGSLAVARVTQKYAESEGDTNAQKAVKQVTRDTLTAGISRATNAAANGAIKTGSGQKLPSNVSSVVGEPKRKAWGADEETKYSQIMGALRDKPEVKAVIRTMRKSEYGVDQMEEYARSVGALQHSMFYESAYLAHHGIPGMKWGVRRYQNYDGSYTQKGLKRYRSAEANANTQYNKLKKAKSDYKSGTGSKEQVKQAKKDYATARSRQIRNYRQLKQDNLADQGKKLYAKGHTVNGNRNAQLAVTTIGSLAGIGAGLLMTGKNTTVRLGDRSWNTDTRVLTMASIYAGTAAVNGILSAKSAHENRRLRAYYGHSTPKD